MEEDSEMVTSSGLRRRSVGTDNNAPNLEVGFKVGDGVIKGTPAPGRVRIFTDQESSKPSSSLIEFRKKQQSFEIHIEDCDEEEISVGSDDEGRCTPDITRPHTPAHILQYPDYSGNVTYTDQQSHGNFLKVGDREQECVTDVSEGESDNDDEADTDEPMQESVIKKVP